MEQFAREFSLSREDLMATAAEFTTRSIAMAVWPILCDDERLSKLYLTGGGRKNTFFAARLSHHLPDVSIQSIDLLGIDGDLVEAASFAALGEMALRGDASSDGAVTRRGRTAVPIRGQIVQPPVLRNDKR
jgi:1,6-anhydro-N-acetylmuramate kinase